MFTQKNLEKYGGTITVQSTTGQHRTFKLGTWKRDDGVIRTISLLNGPDNCNDYTSFGQVSDYGMVRCWKRLEGTKYDTYCRMFNNAEYWQNQGFRFEHAIACRMCNRKLTNPESIASGIGPICSGR